MSEEVVTMKYEGGEIKVPAKLVEGIRIILTHDELKDLLDEKVVEHEAKVADYTNKYLSLAPVEGEEDLEQFTSADPRPSLKKKVEEHRNKVKFFCFLRDHLIPGADYELTENDLYRLDILSRW